MENVNQDSTLSIEPNTSCPYPPLSNASVLLYFSLPMQISYKMNTAIYVAKPYVFPRNKY